MTGKKSLMMLLTVLLISLGFMIFIGGTEPHSGYVHPAGGGTEFIEAVQSTPDEKQELHVQIAATGDSFSRLYEWNAQFMQEHPDVDVQMEQLDPEQAYHTFKHNLQLGQTPDIMLLDNTWVGEFATGGLLLPVDDFFRLEEEVRYFPFLIDQVKWNGYVWGVPKEADPYMLVWNPDVLRAFGYDTLPRTIAQWLELESAMRAQDQIGLYIEREDAYAFASFLSIVRTDWPILQTGADREDDPVSNTVDNERWANVGDSTLDPWSSSTAERDAQDATSMDEERVDADLLDEWVRAILFEQEPLQAPWNALEDGMIGMMIASASDFYRLASPSLQATPVNVLHERQTVRTAKGWTRGTSFVVPAASERKAIALRWIHFMTSEPVQLASLEAGDGLPARPDVYRSMSSPIHEEMLMALEQGASFPVHPDVPAALREHAAGGYRQLEEESWSQAAQLLYMP